MPRGTGSPGAALQHKHEHEVQHMGYSPEQDVANPSSQGKATRGTATLNSRELLALSFQLSNQQFAESQFSVKSNLSLLPYT